MPGKRAQEKVNSRFLPTMAVSPASLQLWWESSGCWPNAAFVRLWEDQIERRCGPELFPVGLIGWLQARVLFAALYLSYPQHR